MKISITLTRFYAYHQSQITSKGSEVQKTSKVKLFSIKVSALKTFCCYSYISERERSISRSNFDRPATANCFSDMLQFYFFDKWFDTSFVFFYMLGLVLSLEYKASGVVSHQLTFRLTPVTGRMHLPKFFCVNGSEIRLKSSLEMILLTEK